MLSGPQVPSKTPELYKALYRWFLRNPSWYVIIPITKSKEVRFICIFQISRWIKKLYQFFHYCQLISITTVSSSMSTHYGANHLSLTISNNTITLQGRYMMTQMNKKPTCIQPLDSGYKTSKGTIWLSRVNEPYL